jgi:hypothetical protein
MVDDSLASSSESVAQGRENGSTKHQDFLLISAEFISRSYSLQVCSNAGIYFLILPPAAWPYRASDKFSEFIGVDRQFRYQYASMCSWVRECTAGRMNLHSDLITGRCSDLRTQVRLDCFLPPSCLSHRLHALCRLSTAVCPRKTASSLMLPTFRPVFLQ